MRFRGRVRVRVGVRVGVGVRARVGHLEASRSPLASSWTACCSVKGVEVANAARNSDCNLWQPTHTDDGRGGREGRSAAEVRRCDSDRRDERRGVSRDVRCEARRSEV